MKKVLVSNIGMLATPKGNAARCGEEQGKIEILKNAWVLIEDGVIAGGFGEKVARVAAAHGLKVLVKGAPKKFEDRFDPKDLLTRAGLTVEKISADVLAHA